MGKLAIILGVPVAMLATVASLGVVVVDVREGGPGGHRILVPFPLVLAQAAVAVAPMVSDHDLRVADREALKHVGVAREVIDALAAAPDGELVRVEEPGEQVVVRKKGDMLEIRVSGREEVTVNAPLRLARYALPDADGHIRTGMLATALGSVRFTDLVEVKGDKEHVRIWVW